MLMSKYLYAHYSLFLSCCCCCCTLLLIFITPCSVNRLILLTTVAAADFLHYRYLCVMFSSSMMYILHHCLCIVILAPSLSPQQVFHWHVIIKPLRLFHVNCKIALIPLRIDKNKNLDWHSVLLNSVMGYFALLEIKSYSIDILAMSHMHNSSVIIMVRLLLCNTSGRTFSSHLC